MKNNNKGAKPELFLPERGKQGWKISRRGFLTGATATGAAVLATGMAAKARGEIQAPFPQFKCPQVTAHTDAVTCLAFSTDGKYLYSGSNDNKIKVWEVSRQGLVKIWTQHTANVSVLTASPNGKWLLSGSEDNKVMVWKLANHTLRKKISKHSNDVSGVGVMPNSNRAFSADKSGYIKYWKVPSGAAVGEWKADTGVYSLAVSPDGQYLATGHYDHVTLWSLRDGEWGRLLHQFGDYNGNVYDIAFSPNSKTLAAASYSKAYIKVWSIPDGTLAKSYNRAHLNKVYSLAVSSDGKHMASGGKNGVVKIWNYPEGGLINKLTIGKVYATALAINPDGMSVAVGQEDGKIRLCSLLTPDHLGCLMDLAANENTKSGTKYKYKDAKGRWVTVTIPGSQCAKPIPAGAVCVCNTVPGACSCVGHSCSCVGYTCGCQGYCSCQGYGHYWYPN